MIETDTDRLEYLKKAFCDLASRTLPIVKFLKYKKDIMQCSGGDKLGIIIKNLVEEICH